MSDQRPDLPRFSRDVRVTGPPAGPTGPWAGVGRPFGGVLDPGVPAGEWPPAGLSHLALGGLLADALRPAPRSESRNSPVSGDDGAASDRSETSGETAEPTVRDVIRKERSTVATRLSSETPAHSEQTDGLRLSTREPPTDRGAPPERDAPPAPREATESSGESVDPTERVTRRDRHEDGPGPDERADATDREGTRSSRAEAPTGEETTIRHERSASPDETPDPSRPVEEREQQLSEGSASDPSVDADEPQTGDPENATESVPPGNRRQPTNGIDGEPGMDATARESVAARQPPGRIASDVAAPRTILRQGRGPAAPTTVSDRTITRLVEGKARSRSPEDTAESAESTSTTGADSTAIPREAVETPSRAWEAPPVERTMPTVPPELSGPAAASAAEGGTSSGPPTPDVVREGDTPGATADPSDAIGPENRTRDAGISGVDLPGRSDPDGSAGVGPAFDGPSMTVLQDDPATGDAADTATASSESGHVQRGSTTSTGDAGDVAAGGSATSRVADARPSPQTRAAGLAPSSDEALSTLIEGMEPGSERVVRRTIENVVRQPRLIDELYHEIERRRRIERERGGEP